MSGPTEQIKHHALEARRWADAADSAATETSAHPDPHRQKNRERAMLYSAVSTGHGLAAIATALGEGFLSVETELVKFAGEKPSEGIPVVPAPRTPSPNELEAHDRVLCVDTEGHAWPDILQHDDPAANVHHARVIRKASDDLYRLTIEVKDGTGPTVQLHREQLRVL